MNFRTITIDDKSLGKSCSLHIPCCAEYFVLEYYEKHRAMPLMEHVLNVAHFAKQGVKVRLK